MYLKLLEHLNLLRMSILCDIFSPEDMLTCDILIQSGIHSCIGHGVRNCRNDWDQSYCQPGAALCFDCCKSCLELSACIFYTPASLSHRHSLPSLRYFSVLLVARQPGFILLVTVSVLDLCGRVACTHLQFRCFAVTIKQ